MSSILENIFYQVSKPSGKWSNYFAIYHKHFDKFLNKNINLLEIGISKGGSVEMWHEYFGGSCNLFAIDLDPQILNLDFDFSVDIVIGDQRDELFWQSYLSTRPKFDIVIDDGYHTTESQLSTLVNVFPHLNEGGILLVEDTHTSYWPNYEGGLNIPNTFIERSKSLIDFLHRDHIEDMSPNINLINIFNDLFSVNFYNSIVVFEKRHYSLSKPVYNNDTCCFKNV